VQGFRKELDLDYTDRIRLSLDGASRLLDAVRPRLDQLARETLAVEVSLGSPPAANARASEASIEGEPLVLGLRRA
jgi:isoleucyl-tRNA synthetase